MKTLLSIGVFVAVIFWTSDEISAVKCWAGDKTVDYKDDNGEVNSASGRCVLQGKGTKLTKTTKDILKQNCTEEICLGQCGRKEMVFKKMKLTQIVLMCVPETQDCDKVEKPDGTVTICKCNTEMCNAGECKVEKKDDEIETCDMGPPPTPKPDSNTDNGANGTSYTHLIIAFIVGAIFFL